MDILHKQRFQSVLSVYVIDVCKFSVLNLTTLLIVWLCLCLFCCFTFQVNSYGHGGTVSSPNHTFSRASLNKQLTSTACTYFHL